MDDLLKIFVNQNCSLSHAISRNRMKELRATFNMPLMRERAYSYKSGVKCDTKDHDSKKSLEKSLHIKSVFFWYDQ